MELGNFLIAGISMLAAAGATVVAWVTLNRGARKEQADTEKQAAADLHRVELTLTDLAGKYTALRHDHDTMQGELAREFDSGDHLAGRTVRSAARDPEGYSR